jgi:UDP-N-acetylmuramoylalanine-D-glutamate ligase
MAPMRAWARATGWWSNQTSPTARSCVLPATIAVVTNVDPEHLDHYGTFDALRDAFVRFVENIPFYGFAVLCSDHPEVQALIPRVADRRIITYGIGANADVRALNLKLDRGGADFDVMVEQSRHQRIAHHHRHAPADVWPAQCAERAGSDCRGAGNGPAGRHDTPRARHPSPASSGASPRPARRTA